MSPHVEEGRLNDFLEELLPLEEAEEVRRHLGGCEICRERATSQERLLRSLRELPVEASPEGDLWGGIEARITSLDSSKPEVIPLRKREPRGHRLSLTPWQLAAAGIAVALFSAAGTWWALTADLGLQQASTDETAVGGLLAASAMREYEQAAMELEEIITQGRHVLSPETVHVLEENLRAVEGAVEETRTALAADPESQTLAQLLMDNMRIRLDVLRRAASMIHAQS